MEPLSPHLTPTPFRTRQFHVLSATSPVGNGEFNTVRRDHLQRVCSELANPITRLAHLAYSSPSTVLASGRPICAATGNQQGDPLGPVLFAMTIDEVASSLSSEINIWYLDVATIGCPAESSFSDLRKCITELKKIDLLVNPSKCGIINMIYPDDEFTELVTLAFDLPGFKRTTLGAPRFRDFRPGSEESYR